MPRRTPSSSGSVAAATVAAEIQVDTMTQSSSSSMSQESIPSPTNQQHPRVRAVRAAMRKSKATTIKRSFLDSAIDQQYSDTTLQSPASAAGPTGLRTQSNRIGANVLSDSHATLTAASTISSESSRSSRRHISDQATRTASKPPWRPILYEAQPYEDNYVDETFLSSMVTNSQWTWKQMNTFSIEIHVRPVTYHQLLTSACCLTQRLCLLLLFLLMFYAMYHQLLPTHTVLLLDSTALFLGTTLVLLMQRQPTSDTADSTACSSAQASPSSLSPSASSLKREAWSSYAWSRVRGLILLTICLLFLSPLLTTLTLSYSSDTIWALTFVLLLLHLLAFDYRWINEAASNKQEFEGVLSLNAGVFASVLLGSRLQSTDDSGAAAALNPSNSWSWLVSNESQLAWRCFGFIWWSMMMFGGMTVVTHQIRRYSLRMHVSFTAGLLLMSSSALFMLISSSIAPLPMVLGPIFVGACVLVQLAGPAVLMWTQRYKNVMYGHWDYDDEAEMQSDNL